MRDWEHDLPGKFCRHISGSLQTFRLGYLGSAIREQTASLSIDGSVEGQYGLFSVPNI